MESCISNEQFDQFVKSNTLLLAYFSSENCGVCHSIKPKIEQLILQQFTLVKMVEIPTDKAPELSARFSVFTVPVILFYVEGREFLREARLISIPELARKMEKIITLYEE